MKRVVIFLIVLLTVSVSVSMAKPQCDDPDTTVVPGMCGDRFDSDGNGIPDAGVKVNGHYTSVYAYDANGLFYWDLGDGRVQGNVGSIDELDASTLTVCDYVNNYRADFGNDPFMDSGWIQNHIRCSGYDDNGTYNYLIVSQSDPRYTGNPDWAVWGTWEYHVLTVSGEGNLVDRLTGPSTAVGN